MTDKRVHRTDAEWRARLTPEQYAVTREAATEAPYSGRYWNSHEHGRYRCVCCGEELFTSNQKFDSACGWPSFTAPSSEATIEKREDRSCGMTRTEVVCHACGAHLGHVFDDGPGPTGQRYCINSAALELDRATDSDKGGVAPTS